MRIQKPGIRPVIIAALVAAPVIALGACSQDGADSNAAATACEGPGVVVSEAWMRAARAQQPMSAAYLTVCNGADADDALIGVSFAGAQHAELHQTTMKEGGVASMTTSPELALPAGEFASLAPGGGHIMLMGLEKAFEPGDAPVMQLQFKNAPSIEVVLEVRAASEQSR